jgi:hypothetical protein
MELKPDFVFRPLPEIDKPLEFALESISSPLGPLQDLVGTWVGHGFNTIWRPNHTPPGQDRFLELNLTLETLQVEEIKGAIPNRGLLQGDINMFGVTYLQQIQDRNVKAGLHIEPGIWATVPKTTNPAEVPTVVRMGSIPHGTTILAQGVASAIAGPPQIAPVDITPFPVGNPAQKIHFPESNLSVPSAFRSPPANIAGVTQALVNNPNSLLTTALTGQTVLTTTVLNVSTHPILPVVGGGTSNTAFLQGTPAQGPNAVSALVSSIFWIETVKGLPGKPNFHQLQYTQTVLLNFNGLSWPHVTVGSLIRQ